MSWRRPLSRRTILRGAAGVTVALPLLEAMLPARARAARPVPKRFVVFFSGNGTIHHNWAPRAGAGETQFTLSPILQPLQRHQRDLVVIDGVDQQGGGADAHLDGIGGLLTGAEIKIGRDVNQNTGKRLGWANGISVDQRIAEAIGTQTKLKSLDLGVQCFPGYYGRISFSAPGRPVVPEPDPASAFARLFGDGTHSARELRRLRAEDRSVLDAVLDQFRAVKGSLGAPDGRYLEAHLDSVRELERRLSAAPGPACAPPRIDAAPDPRANDSFPMIGRLHMDLLVTALACDLTRVGSLMWGGAAGGGPRFTWIGITDEHHKLSHDGDGNQSAVEQLTRINRWYAEQLAYLVDRCKAVRDASGSLFDHCLVLWGNELGKGNSHSRKDAPYVLAGSAGGALRTGRYLRYDGDVPHNNLLVSLCNAMGIPATTFGKPEWCTGPLARLG